MATLTQELEDELVNRPNDVLIIVGAGVSIASSNHNSASSNHNSVASWIGLLRNAVDYCGCHCSPLSTGWAERKHAQLDADDPIELILVAEDISTRLGCPDGGEFARWLSESVGLLQPTAPELIQTLAAWQVQLATTNYDDLIEKITKKESLTWLERGRAFQFLRRELADVLHLHGVWNKPASVILGVQSYDRIEQDEGAQSLLHALLMTRTIVFVGFGAGMSDPNFTKLLKWSQRVLSSSMHRHYRLASDSELENCNRQHPSGSRVFTLGYGPTHDHLLEAVS